MGSESQARFLERNWYVLLADYHEEQFRARVVWTRRAAVIAIVFVVAGGVMDTIAYPGMMAVFLQWRAACAGFLAVLLGLCFLPIGRIGIQAVGHLVAASPAALVLYMVLETAGGVSPYYAALNLVMLGSCLLLRWRVVDGFIHTSFCLSGYLAIALATATPLESLALSLTFLATTAIICCVGLHFYEQLRFREFRVRWIAGKTATPQAAPAPGGGRQPGPGPDGP